MKCIPHWLVLVLASFVVATPLASAEPRSESDRLAVARAFVELMEQGYPGPALTDLAPWALLRPFSLLDGTTAAASEDDLRLRACLLAARRLRIERLTRAGPQGADWDLLTQKSTACAQRFARVHVNHAQFCAVAALESARGNLARARRAALQERCAEPIVTISMWEHAVDRATSEAPEPDEPETERSPFERRYQTDLVGFWQSAHELRQAREACVDRGDCVRCRKVLRHYYTMGRTEQAHALAAIMAKATPETVACQQTLATVAAWRQDWEELHRHLESVAEPRPEWAYQLALYSQLQGLAEGSSQGSVAPNVEELFSSHAQPHLLRFAAEALARAAQAFRHPAEIPGTTAWLVKASLQPEVVAAGEPALAVGLTFLWALAPTETVFNFMDEVLSQAGDEASDDVVVRIAIEILSVATRENDVERLQQALVLLRRVVNAEEKRTPCHEAEFFLRFAEWLDGRMYGQNEEALRRFQDRLNILRVRLPKCASARLRGLTVINLLAAAMVRRGGTVHETGPHLEALKTRNVTYHILWVNQFLEQRQTARARAVIQWCEHEARAPEGEAACQLWRAYLHELVGEPAFGDVARARATEILGDRYAAAVARENLLLVEGERRVGFAVSPQGLLDFRTTYTPAFFLVPLPRLGTIRGAFPP